MRFRCVRCGHVFISRNPRERRCSKCRSRLIMSEGDYNFILSKFRELEESRTPLITGIQVLNDIFRKLRLAHRPVLTLSMLNCIARDARRQKRTKVTVMPLAADPLKTAVDKLDLTGVEEAIKKIAEKRENLKIFPRVYYRELFPRIRNRRILIRVWCYFDLAEEPPR